MQPDVIVTAKGITSGYLPLGAALFAEPIADVPRSGANGFPVGFTYFGHPVACAIALKDIEILEQENLLDAARTTGRLLHDLAAPLADRLDRLAVASDHQFATAGVRPTANYPHQPPRTSSGEGETDGSQHRLRIL
jgi:adenosylmethionine-8-amino-7-oxononanoate aminotransferase